MKVEEYDGVRWVQVIRASRGVYGLAIVCTLILAAAILATGWGY